MPFAQTQPLTPRRRQTKARQRGFANRDSNSVRASVLQTALDLGIVHNPTFADWIFNSPLEEEPEEEESSNTTHALRPERAPLSDPLLDPLPELDPETVESITPTLTCSSSNSPSDDSSVLNSPQNTNVAGASGLHHTQASMRLHSHTHTPSVFEPPHVHFDDFPAENLQLLAPSALPPDGSSLVVKQSTESQRGSSLSRSNESPSPGPTEGYSSDGQHLSKVKGKKDKGRRLKKWMKPAALELGKGDELDGDHASDGGYLSASSIKSLTKSPGKTKARALAFFKRRSKKSLKGSDDEDEDAVPPVPALPMLHRPSSPTSQGRSPALAPSSSPTRPGFTPLTLNFSSPPTSPIRSSSKSPPPVLLTSAPPPLSAPPLSRAFTPASALAHLSATRFVSSPTADPSTPSSVPATPLSTASFSVSLSKPPAGSRHHLTLPPPVPPPSQPLPQLPPSPLPVSSRRGCGPSPTPRSPPPSGSPLATSSVSAPTTPVAPPSTPIKPTKHALLFRSISPRPAPQPRWTPDLPVRAQTTPGHNGLVSMHPLQGYGPGQGPGYESGNGNEPGSGHPTMLRQNSAPIVSRSVPPIPSSSVAPPPMPTQTLLHRRLHGSSTGANPHVLGHGKAPLHPPPDVPLPPAPERSPVPAPMMRYGRMRGALVSPSKFHEHFSSVSSVGGLAAPSRSGSTSLSISSASASGAASATGSPAPSCSGSSSGSGPSVHSSCSARTSTGTTTSAGSTPMPVDSTPPSSDRGAAISHHYGSGIRSGIQSNSELGTELGNNGLPIRLVSRFSDASLSVYTPLGDDEDEGDDDDDDDDKHEENDAPDIDEEEDGSYLDLDRDVDTEEADAYGGDEDGDGDGDGDGDRDDASCYPSDEKTAGRRTMYLLEQGHVDDNGDTVVMAGSRFWGGTSNANSPRIGTGMNASLPPMPVRPRRRYF